jgi:hypothetical protein
MTAPKFTPAELEVLVAIVTDGNPEHQQQRLHEAFGDSSGRATDRLIEASVAVDRLRNGLPVDLGDGTVFARDAGAMLRPRGTRFTEALGTTPARRDRYAGGLRRMQAHVGDCWRVGRLWVDPALVNLEASILEAAYQTAATWPLVLSVTPGRLTLDGEPWELQRLRGRCALDVALLRAGRPVGVGTVVEVLHHDDTEAWWHELVHASGVRDETTTARLGQLAARAADRQG